MDGMLGEYLTMKRDGRVHGGKIAFSNEERHAGYFTVPYDACGTGWLPSVLHDGAARLLNERRYTLDFIAETCGYKEYSSFYRNFVSQIGISPTDYRKMKIDRRDLMDE